MEQVDLRTGVPHSARIYDYLLGGKDNYQLDREVGDRIAETDPSVRTSMRANRRFMARAASYLAAEVGIRQFLDIGTGLPTSPNLHEAVQAVDPTCRVVYVDNDPIVLVHARALLTSSKEGATAYLDADLRDADAILNSREVRGTLDLNQPVGISLIAILHFITDDDEAQRIIHHLMDPLPSGSALVISVLTNDNARTQTDSAVQVWKEQGIPIRARRRAEVEAFFTGYELVDPGVTLVHRWRPDEIDRAIPDNQVKVYGAIALKR